MATKPINVVIKGDYTDRDINRAVRDLERLKTQGSAATGAFGGFANSLKGFGAGLVASIGFTEIIGALTSMGQAAMDDEVKMASLAKTLDNVGQGFRSTDVEQFIGQMQLASGVADNDLRVAFQKLVTVTGDVQRSQEALRLAMDISAGTGKDLDAVSLALAKAYGGQTTALQRLGVGLDAALLKSKDMGAITDALSSKFSGQAAVAAETYQGQMNRLTQAVGEAQEAIGYALLRAMDDMIGKMGGTGGLQQSIIQAGDSIADMIDNISLTVTQVDRLGRSFVTLTTGGLVQVDENVSLVDQGFQALIDSVTSLLAGPLVNLVAFLEDLGWVSGDASSATSDLALEHEHMARSSRRAAGGIGVLTEETEAAAAAALTAARGYYAFYEASAAAARIQRDLANTSGTVSSAIQQGFSERFLAGPGKFASLYGEVERAARGAAGGTRAAKDATSEYDSKLKEHQDTLQNAIKAAQDYATSVSQTFVNGLDLSAALDAAKESGKSIVDEFIAQGERMKAFSENLQRLLGAGLSRTAFDAIIRAGADRGADIANALANGNIAENVRNVNKVYDSVAQMGNIVGERASYNFELAGIVTAQGFLESFIKEFMPAGKKRRQLLSSIDDMVNEALAKMGRLMGMSMPAIAVASAPSSGAVSMDLGAAMAAYTGPTFTAPVDFNAFGAGVQLFADGGIVTRPTLGVFGEAGPEAVIPLDRMGSGGNTYNINVSTGVGDPRQIGEQVVSYIKRFEAASGPVFARA